MLCARATCGRCLQTVSHRRISNGAGSVKRYSQLLSQCVVKKVHLKPQQALDALDEYPKSARKNII